VAAVYESLNTSATGLSAAEARRRLQIYGPNRLPEARPRHPLLRLFAQFHNILIYVLLGAAVVTALLAHWVDTGVILGVVVINALIGFIQEGKAEDALRGIRRMLSPRAMVLREGRRVVLPAEQLVPGDVVFLQPGDRVPADLRLTVVKHLQIQEAALTGESLAVEKGVEPVPASTPLGDRRDMAYSGTLVSSGQGTGVVVETGARTEIGRISTLVAEVEALTTPLLRQMDQFGRWLTAAILGVAVFGFVFGVLIRGYTTTEMFLAAVGLAVAAIPEGLPAIMTITLATGVQRMARRHAIIRRLPAVETLGSVSVICSDKTGTLTRNEMAVRNLVTTTGIFELTGVGYDPHGSYRLEAREVRPQDHPELIQALRAAILCNDAQLEHRDGQWRVHGDPLEGALLVAGLKAGLDPEIEIRRYPRTDIIPFESEYRFMATLHHSHRGEAFVFVKGAPERILDMCTGQRSVHGQEPLDRKRWESLLQTLATRGQRILAVAAQTVASSKRDLEFADVADGLVFLGLFGLIDPPRDEAIAAIGRCQAAGIRIKMITGDHAATAQAIARQLHLANPDEALDGRKLDSLPVAELRERVGGVDVYARVSPGHKLRLVSLLQELGWVVAMTGDGVNDAPALKRADVGIAMGQSGTEAAKEAADMVLADDNFASIAHAVEEGRTVYDNLKKAILFILPTSGGEALIVLGAILAGFHQLPLTPLQILWVNMVTAVTLGLALAFEPPEAEVMRRPPRDPAQPLLTPFFLWRIAFVSLLLVAGTFGLFLWEIDQGTDIAQARTVAVNTLVLFEVFYLFNARYIVAPVVNRAGLLGNPYVLGAIGVLLVFQLMFTYLGPVQALFGTAGIGAAQWGRILLTASSVLFLVEIEKAVIRRLFHHGPDSRRRSPGAVA